MLVFAATFASSGVGHLVRILFFLFRFLLCFFVLLYLELVFVVALERQVAQTGGENPELIIPQPFGVDRSASPLHGHVILCGSRSL